MAAAHEYEAVSEALLDGCHLEGETASEAVRDLVATAAAAELASEALPRTPGDYERRCTRSEAAQAP